MHKEFPQYKFSLYFLGYLPKGMRKEDLPPPNSAARDVLATLAATREASRPPSFHSGAAEPEGEAPSPRPPKAKPERPGWRMPSP